MTIRSNHWILLLLAIIAADISLASATQLSPNLRWNTEADRLEVRHFNVIGASRWEKHDPRLSFQDEAALTTYSSSGFSATEHMKQVASEYEELLYYGVFHESRFGSRKFIERGYQSLSSYLRVDLVTGNLQACLGGGTLSCVWVPFDEEYFLENLSSQFYRMNKNVYKDAMYLGFLPADLVAND